MKKLTEKEAMALLSDMPKNSIPTSFLLSLKTMAYIRTIMRISGCPTQVAAIEQATASYAQSLPKLFPIVTHDDIRRVFEEELEWLKRKPKQKPGRPKKSR